MKLNQKGLLIVLSGPSGVGKGTVRKALFEEPNHQYTYSVSATTRSPRTGEVEGVDYYFVNHDRFREMIDKGELLEHAEFVGNFYGTPMTEVDRAINEGKEVILEIEVEGAMQVKAKKPDAVFIFIAPPSFEVLKSRLLKRGTEHPDVIKARIDKSYRELKLASSYDYIVINDEVSNAADRIKAIIRAEHARCSRSLNGYFELLEEYK